MATLSNKLDRLIDAVSNNEVLINVDLSSCNLSSIPDIIYQHGEHIETLNLGNNSVSDIPDDIIKLRKLRILFFADNKFETVPLVLGSMESLYMLSFKNNRLSSIPDESLSTSLGWLIVTGNSITALPSSIGKLTKLRKLMLSGNQIQELPYSMRRCTELELLRLSDNCLTSIPSWLLELPKLSWLAFNGNPISAFPSDYNKSDGLVAEIDWKDVNIEMSHKLGEGASGMVYRGKRNSQTAACDDDVAVKLYKGESTTSDGLPTDEISLSLGIGDHPNCIKVLGRLVNHPTGSPGLVLALIDPLEYTILGDPPSFMSVTRDVYTNNSRCFYYSDIFTILSGVCSVCIHLHKRKISHGDVYGHNILLRNKDCFPLLTDFGAATLYSAVTGIGNDIEYVEVRAFGCLIDDLLHLYHLSNLPSDDASTTAAASSSSVGIDTLIVLRDKCMLPIPSNRPTFELIEKQLNDIMITL